jgi:CheY-like chemotaxis protein
VKKILLADDSITIQKVVELTFSEGDYQVVCVSNGAQAIKKVQELRPDVVLLDVIMPEKNGYEVCEHLKRSPSTSGIPVLLLTGTFEPFDKRRADAAGANGHLTKPFESQLLVSKVEELIKATPHVVPRDEAGRMEVISGGDIYHVDPARAGEGMRPSLPPADAGMAGAGAAGALRAHADTTPSGAAAPPDPGAEPGEETWTHPALAAPDPAAGGSYVGFADLGAGADEPEIVPDRYEEPSPGSATVRLRRPDLAVGPRADAREGEEASEVHDLGEVSGEAVEGLTGAFEMADPPASHPAGPVAGGAEEPWAPPAEAPPAEAWRDPADEDAPAGADPPAPGGGNGVPGLTPEAIELIAEKVVQRMSDRVVREIAWEVIPEVAEAIVRRRIKELEEKGS